MRNVRITSLMIIAVLSLCIVCETPATSCIERKRAAHFDVTNSTAGRSRTIRPFYVRSRRTRPDIYFRARQ